MNKVLTLLLFISLSTPSFSQTLIQEARQQYENFISDRFVTFKSDHFLLKHYKTYGESWELTQMKKLKTGLQTDSISEIEKLNGIEWKGFIVINALALRNIYWVPQNIAERKWAEWYAFKEVKLPIYKKWNKWKIDSSTFNYSNELPAFPLINDALSSPINVME